MRYNFLDAVTRQDYERSAKQTTTHKIRKKIQLLQKKNDGQNSYYLIPDKFDCHFEVVFFLFFHVVIINVDLRKALLYLGQTNNIYRCASLHVYLEGFEIMGVGSGWREIGRFRPHHAGLSTNG